MIFRTSPGGTFLKKPNGDAWTFIVFFERTWKVWYVTFCVSKMGFNDTCYLAPYTSRVLPSPYVLAVSHRSCVVGPQNRVENTVCMRRGARCVVHFGRIPHRSMAGQAWCEQWKQGPWLLRVWRGWKTAQLCGDYYWLFHKPWHKDPY